MPALVSGDMLGRWEPLAGQPQMLAKAQLTVGASGVGFIKACGPCRRRSIMPSWFRVREFMRYTACCSRRINTKLQRDVSASGQMLTPIGEAQEPGAFDGLMDTGSRQMASPSETSC